jgi:hypothetical protein
MLFDSELKVPEKESTIHLNLKDRERAKLDNQRKSKKEDVWAPTFEVCQGIEEGSAAAMVQPAKRRLEVSTLCFAVIRERF